MTPDEFRLQINRLDLQWPKTYSTERTGLIWKEVNTLPPEAFKRVVDKLLGECRQAPLLPEMRDIIAIEREKIHEREKRERQSEFAQWRSSYDITDIKTLCAFIRNRISGATNDEEWRQHVKTMESIAGTQGCRGCDGSGVRFKPDSEGHEWAYRCACPEGSKYGTFPRYQ